MKKKEILGKIDHSILKATSTEQNVIQGCESVKNFEFATLCVLPKHTIIASKILPREKIATVIAFPLCGVTFNSMLFEIEQSIISGTGELDVVLNISDVKEGKWGKIQKEFKEIRTVTKGVVIKLIMECCYLTEEEKKRAGIIAVNEEWDYLKTSTGYGIYGATEEDVKLLKEIAGKKAKVKASGGIKTAEDVIKFIKLGADRIGTSSGERIAHEILHHRKV